MMLFFAFVLGVVLGLMGLGLLRHVYYELRAGKVTPYEEYWEPDAEKWRSREASPMSYWFGIMSSTTLGLVLVSTAAGCFYFLLIGARR